MGKRVEWKYGRNVPLVRESANCDVINVPIAYDCELIRPRPARHEGH